MKNKRYSAQDAAELLVRLATLGDANPPEVHRALKKLADAKVGGVVPSRASAKAVHEATVSDVAGWQQRVSGLAKRFLGVQSVGIQPVFSTRDVRLEASPSSSAVEMFGAPLDVLSVQTVLLLHIAGNRVRKCNCEVLFVRTGRRKFCSSRCQKRFYMRRFRAGEAGNEEG